MHTQVAIIGAGPAGLLLSHVLYKHGIEAVVLEVRSRDYVEARIRAGVLEQCTVDLLHDIDVDGRLNSDGLVHDGFAIALNGERQRINLKELSGGKSVTVYGQTQMVQDLVSARLAQNAPLYFEAVDVSLHDIDSDKPRVEFTIEDKKQSLTCDFIAGCDGFYGISRHSIPPEHLRFYERVYPFAWLGILAETTPPSEELIYAKHDRGFALFSMRSSTISRNYLQCVPDENLDEWPDDRIWEELNLRLSLPSGTLVEGPVIEKGVTPMRSFVAEPMRYGNLFLAGDAAHIVPPTGAKGLNLAAGDIHYLSIALVEYYRNNNTGFLDQYSATALKRVWKTQRFSWWMTSLLHKFPDNIPFNDCIQQAEIEYVLSSVAAQTTLAENYVGLPF